MKVSIVLKFVAIDSKLNVIRFDVCSSQYVTVVIRNYFIQLQHHCQYKVQHLLTTMEIMHISQFFVGQNQTPLLDYYYFFKETVMGCLCAPYPRQYSVNKTQKPFEKLRETDATDNTTKQKPFVFATLQFPHSIVKQALQDMNINLKLIEHSNNKQLFVLKYLIGNTAFLKETSKAVKEYSKLSFAYLAPLLQHQIQSTQILLRIDYFPHIMEELIAEHFHKSDKLIIFYRIVRAVHYLEKAGVRHNKIEIGNVFFKSKENRSIFLGLPSWGQQKKKDKLNTRIAHINSLCKIFKTLFPQPPLDQATNNLIKSMDDCANNELSLTEILQTILSLNFLDDIKTIEQSKKTLIQYLEGDHYEGEVDLNKNKQGYGIMTQSQTKYWGHWTNNLRSNRGNFQCTEYVYVGEWKDNKRSGFGLQINKKTREYYEGYFINQQKNNFGIWEGTNGQVYVGNWNQNQREGHGTYFDGNGEFYYEGEWAKDMKNGKGKQVHRNDCSYQGEFKDNIKDGIGHYIHPGKFEYEGQFKQNLITGQGTFTDKDGNKYTGTLVNGVFEGKGKIVNKDNTYFYDGEWKNGARHGAGEEKTKESHYIGTFTNNKRNGKGILKELNQTYTGQFKMGKVTGMGEYLYQNGDTYKGTFIDKLKDGEGVYISAKDGSIYKGYWLQDRKQGHGKHTLKNGEYYQGEWFQSKREGYGVHFINDQNRYEGSWKQDRKEGKGIQYQSGNKYEGQFKNGLKHSQFATLIFTNGDIYQGSFIDNKQQGQGKYTWSNGDEYIGDFLANNREGTGVMKTKKDDASYQGGWKNDQKEGDGVERYKDGSFAGQFLNDKKNGKGVMIINNSQGTYKFTGPWVNDLKHGEFQCCFPDQTIEKREYSNDRQINLGMTAVPY